MKKSITIDIYYIIQLSAVSSSPWSILALSDMSSLRTEIKKRLLSLPNGYMFLKSSIRGTQKSYFWHGLIYFGGSNGLKFERRTKNLLNFRGWREKKKKKEFCRSYLKCWTVFIYSIVFPCFLQNIRPLHKKLVFKSDLDIL